MLRTRKWILPSLAIVALAMPAYALMEFFGAQELGRVASWPKGLEDLLNHESRFAASIGPIVDWNANYAGDTKTLNEFLIEFAKLEDTALKVYIQDGSYSIDMKRYDDTDRKIVADWTMHIAEHYKGRSDEEKFEGKRLLAEIRINPENHIDLKELQVPLSLGVETTEKYREFEDRHNKRRNNAEKQ
ncbi:MAG: hypothetical protein AMXMBFR84_33760 [Candidatus Hydrogenedentota bacterium]